MFTLERSDEKTLIASLRILNILLKGIEPRNFAIRLWDGVTQAATTASEPQFTVTINNPAVLRQLVLHPHCLFAAESFIDEGWDVEGDTVAMFSFAEHLEKRQFSTSEKAELLTSALALPSSKTNSWLSGAHLSGKIHSAHRDTSAIQFHYDLPADFYRLWLDKNLQYSAAYFESDTETLDDAQEAKLKLICERLELRPGESFFDLGCGWGGLIVYAAKHYGVHSLGITLSEEQARFAREWIQREGLSDQCRVELRHFSEMAGTEKFDKIASVGMIEHVGASCLDSYFHKSFEVLKPGGFMLNSGITVPTAERTSRSNPFIEKYVFPDGELVSFSNLVREAEKVGFEVRGDLNLREHYGLALEHWSKNLEASRREIEKLTDRATFRIFKLYLAGCAYSFLHGHNQVHQTLMLKAPDSERNWGSRVHVRN